MRALQVEAVHPDDLTPADRTAWLDLEQAGTTRLNPFITPIWVDAWYQQFARADDRVLHLVRDPGGQQLLGVAPMVRQEIRIGPVQMASQLVPVGTSIDCAFELPGFLSRPGYHREVAQALVGACLRSDTTWSSMTLQPEQGWVQAEFLAQAGGGFLQYRRATACVVLDLEPTWAATHEHLKRNLKESLRRSRNRMLKSPHRFTTVMLTGSQLDRAAAQRFLDLHRARATNQRAGVGHANAYANPRAQELWRTVLPALAADGRASLFELHRDGRVVACQIVLHGVRTSYLHSSGFLPEVWEYGPITHLTGEAVRHSIGRGDRSFNLSPGPQESKLRWSENLWVSHEFALGAPPKSSLGLRLSSYLRMIRPGELRVARVAAAQRSAEAAVGQAGRGRCSALPGG